MRPLLNEWVAGKGHAAFICTSCSPPSVRCGEACCNSCIRVKPLESVGMFRWVLSHPGTLQWPCKRCRGLSELGSTKAPFSRSIVATCRMLASGVLRCGELRVTPVTSCKPLQANATASACVMKRSFHEQAALIPTCFALPGAIMLDGAFSASRYVPVFTVQD